MGLLWLSTEVMGKKSARWKVREKGAVETGSGGQPGMSCRCSLLPVLQVSWGPLEFRRKKIHSKRKFECVCPTKGMLASLF